MDLVNHQKKLTRKKIVTIFTNLAMMTMFFSHKKLATDSYTDWFSQKIQFLALKKREINRL